MKIRNKIIFALGLLTLILFSALHFASGYFVSRGFNQVETEAVTKSVIQAFNGTNNLVDQVTVKISDWAAWDATYAFAVDKNQGYLDENITLFTLDYLKIDLIVIIDNSNQIIGSVYRDPITQKEALLPEVIKSHIKPGSLLLDHPTSDQKYKGLIVLPDNVLAIAANPILNSKFEGPIHGTLVFGKFFDDNTKRSLSTLTNLSINFYRYNNLPNEEKLIKIAKSFPNLQSMHIEPDSLDTISGYITLNDIYDKPALLIQSSEPRKIYQQGRKSENYFLLFLLILSAANTIFSVSLVDYFLTKRIIKLSAKLTTIDPVKDSESLVEELGKDEISILGKAINGLFVRIRQSANEIKTLSDNLKIKNDLAEQSAKLSQEKLMEIKQMNEQMVGRELKMIELKDEIAKLKSRSE